MKSFTCQTSCVCGAIVWRLQRRGRCLSFGKRRNVQLETKDCHLKTRTHKSWLKMCSLSLQRRWSRQKPFSPHVQNVNIQLGRWTSLGRRRSVSLGVTPLLTPPLPKTALSGSLDRLWSPPPHPPPSTQHTHTQTEGSLRLLIGLHPRLMDHFNHYFTPHWISCLNV